jgi:hypothetical protein
MPEGHGSDWRIRHKRNNSSDGSHRPGITKAESLNKELAQKTRVFWQAEEREILGELGNSEDTQLKACREGGDKDKKIIVKRNPKHYIFRILTNRMIK